MVKTLAYIRKGHTSVKVLPAANAYTKSYCCLLMHIFIRIEMSSINHMAHCICMSRQQYDLVYALPTRSTLTGVHPFLMYASENESYYICYNMPRHGRALLVELKGVQMFKIGYRVECKTIAGFYSGWVWQ